jgi:hypothetical protein
MTITAYPLQRRGDETEQKAIFWDKGTGEVSQVGVEIRPTDNKFFS